MCRDHGVGMGAQGGATLEKRFLCGGCRQCPECPSTLAVDVILLGPLRSATIPFTNRHFIRRLLDTQGWRLFWLRFVCECGASGLAHGHFCAAGRVDCCVRGCGTCMCVWGGVRGCVCHDVLYGSPHLSVVSLPTVSVTHRH